MITTLLWDLDNTLLDFPSAERQALITTFADFTLGPCSPDLLVRYSALNARWWRRLEEGDVTKAELLPGRFREFFAAEGIACTEYDAFNAAYQHHLGDTIVFLDNGYELVKKLHQDRMKQYLVTNGSLQAQTRKLKRSGLGELFDGVFISEVVGAEKPSRAFFDAVLSAIGPVDKEELLRIGDSLTSDMAGGCGAGIPCCWYDPKGLPVPEDLPIRHTIRNLNEIPQILAASK